MDMPDFKRLLMDSTYCKAHPHAAGAKGGKEALGRTKEDSIAQDTSDRGCAWYAGQNHYYRRYLCRYLTDIPSC